MKVNGRGVGLSVLAAVAAVLLLPRGAGAHCDTLDGPVVTDAKAALEKGDVTPVLKWVKKAAEDELRTAFLKTLTVRAKGPEAKELADLYFFETLVRLHRAGEGAPYTGLKPAGAVEPIVAASDKALDSGSADGLVNHVGHSVANGIRKRFEGVVEAKKHADESVEAGRAYVAAYVEFVHYVERLDEVAASAGHHAEPKEQATEHHQEVPKAQPHHGMIERPKAEPHHGMIPKADPHHQE